MPSSITAITESIGFPSPIVVPWFFHGFSPWFSLHPFINRSGSCSQRICDLVGCHATADGICSTRLRICSVPCLWYSLVLSGTLWYSQLVQMQFSSLGCLRSSIDVSQDLSRYFKMNSCGFGGLKPGQATLILAIFGLPRTGLSAAISACEKGTAWRRAMSTFHTTAIAVQPDIICISAVTGALENCVSNLLQDLASPRVPRAASWSWISWVLKLKYQPQHYCILYTYIYIYKYIDIYWHVLTIERHLSTPDSQLQ